LYKRPSWKRPQIPHESYLDEFGNYANRLVPQTFEMGRAAGCAMIPMFQTYANLLNIGEEFADQIVGNTEFQTILTLGDPNSAEFAAKITGEILKKFKLESRSRTRAAGNKNLQLQVFHTTSQGESEQTTLREDYDYRIRPEEFIGLDVGEAFVFAKTAKAGFKIKFPMVAPREGSGGFCLHRFERAQRAGLNLAAKFDTKFSSSLADAAA
jgi:TraM recognition site of TraD and TraG